MAVTFRSKIDWWLAIPLVIVFAGALLAVFVSIMLGSWLMLLIPVASTAFVCWIALRTFYRVDNRILLVQSGPFRWRIAIKEIHQITATSNPLSSPALSLDRLRIEYGKGSSIMVSPQDKEGFLAAIKKDRFD